MTQDKLSNSISGTQAYAQVCLNASIDYQSFNNFRRNPIYNNILEHVSKEQGFAYLQKISKNEAILSKIEEFKMNDLWGNPVLHEYPGIGKISPTTLRYIKVLNDLGNLFKSLNQLSICEIGVGYGGQCRIINTFYKPKNYKLVDIHPALSLARRFLDEFIMPASISYTTMNELETRSYDLVISNYAFSELSRPVQDVYLERVIKNARMGYMTCNTISPKEFRSYTGNELTHIIHNSHILNEEPLTATGNYIIAWGMPESCSEQH